MLQTIAGENCEHKREALTSAPIKRAVVVCIKKENKKKSRNKIKMYYNIYVQK